MLSALHETDHDQRAQLLECLLPGGGVVSEIVGSVLACYSIILTPPPAAAAWPRLSGILGGYPDLQWLLTDNARVCSVKLHLNLYIYCHYEWMTQPQSISVDICVSENQ